MDSNHKSQLVSGLLNAFDRGWVKAIDQSSHKIIYLCENTLVKSLLPADDVFIIVSGSNKGRKVKIQQNFFGKVPVLSLVREFVPAHLLIDSNFLFYNNHSLKLINPITLTRGSYDIGYPDIPRHIVVSKYHNHKKGTTFAGTWFPILNAEGNVYIHLGTYNLGCITIDYLDSNTVWDDLYMYLISSHTTGNIAGVLEIK